MCVPQFPCGKMKEYMLYERHAICLVILRGRHLLVLLGDVVNYSVDHFLRRAITEVADKEARGLEAKLSSCFRHAGDTAI